MDGATSTRGRSGIRLSAPAASAARTRVAATHASRHDRRGVPTATGATGTSSFPSAASPSPDPRSASGPHPSLLCSPSWATGSGGLDCPPSARPRCQYARPSAARIVPIGELRSSSAASGSPRRARDARSRKIDKQAASMSSGFNPLGHRNVCPSNSNVRLPLPPDPITHLTSAGAFSFTEYWPNRSLCQPSAPFQTPTTSDTGRHGASRLFGPLDGR